MENPIAPGDTPAKPKPAFIDDNGILKVDPTDFVKQVMDRLSGKEQIPVKKMDDNDSINVSQKNMGQGSIDHVHGLKSSYSYEKNQTVPDGTKSLPVNLSANTNSPFISTQENPQMKIEPRPTTTEQPV